MLLFAFIGCANGNARKKNIPPSQIEVNFSMDSAFSYVFDQVAFGPRVPETEAHEQCLKYLVAKLTSWGWKVELQEDEVNNYANKMQPVRNILARYEGTESQKENILLCAHYDTRPWADEEEEYEDRFEPILGANDGASGVGVVLEVARQISLMKPKKNVFIALFDCEDMGTPRFHTEQPLEDSWCLGSQLWAHYNQDKIQYGILLDMVGDHNAIFPKEYFSMQYASPYVDKIWHNAKKLGFSQYFIDELAYPVTDDHYYINVRANIPCVDIIHYEGFMKDANTTKSFVEYWHTQKDDMRNINKQTLEAVGKTVLYTILN